MQITIRADGGKKIGMGHIMRGLVLADKLKKYFPVKFLCQTDPSDSDKFSPGIEKITNQGYEVEYIKSNNLNKELRNIKGDCIITDSYQVDEEYFNIVKKNFSVSGYLDDEKICDFFNVDFLINQNIYADIFDYKVPEHTKMFLGPQYILLRDEFIKRPVKNINNEIKKIMVTLGGSDDSNLTEKIINKLKNHYQIDVVVGPGFKYKDKLNKLRSANTTLHFNANMYQLMKKADVAITSCGSTIYELAFCGTPTLGLSVIDNQKIAQKTMCAKGAMIKLECQLTNILKILDSLSKEKRAMMSLTGQKMVDGMGPQRIEKQILKILNPNTKSKY